MQLANLTALANLTEPPTSVSTKLKHHKNT